MAPATGGHRTRPSDTSRGCLSGCGLRPPVKTRSSNPLRRSPRGGRQPVGRRRARGGSPSPGHSRGRRRRLVGRGGRSRSGEDGRPPHLRGGGHGDGRHRRCRWPLDHRTVCASSRTSVPPLRKSCLCIQRTAVRGLSTVGRWADLPRQTDEPRSGDRPTRSRQRFHQVVSDTTARTRSRSRSRSTNPSPVSCSVIVVSTSRTYQVPAPTA